MTGQRRLSPGEPLRTVCALLIAVLGGVACDEDASVHGPGFGLTVAPLTLPGVSYVCYDVEVRGPAGSVVRLGDPGRSYLDGDAGTICSWQYGNSDGGDISYVAPCDADDGDDQSPAEADNTVTIWFDGIYRDADDDHDPAEDVDIGDWQNPCPDGCSLSVLCRENSDTAVTFDFTVMREAHQGFFDIGVDFDDIFCSAKLDCVDALLHDADGERGPTVVVAFACTTGVGAPTWLHTSDLVLTCDDADPLTPPIVQTLAAAGAGPGQHGAQAPGVFEWATYAGDEQLTSGGEALQKCYYNRAVGLATRSLMGRSCRLTATATATDVPSLGQVLTDATTYPMIEWDVEVLSATGELCGNNALDADGSGVTTRYLAAAPAQPLLPVTTTIPCGVPSPPESTLTTSIVPTLDARGWSPVPVSLRLASQGQGPRKAVAIAYRIDDGPEVVVPGDTLSLDFPTAGVFRVSAWEIDAEGTRSDAIRTQVAWQPTFPDLALGPFRSLLGLVVRSAVTQAGTLNTGVTYNHSAAQGQLLQAIGDLLWAARFYELGDADDNGVPDRYQLITLAMGELGELEAAAYQTTTAGPAFGVDVGGDAWAWQTGSVAVGVASLARVLAFHQRPELAQALAFGQALLGAWDAYFTEIGSDQGFFWATNDAALYAEMAVHNQSALMANASMILAELGGPAAFVAQARDRSRRYARYLTAHIEVDAAGAAFWMYADDESGHARTCTEQSVDAAGRTWTDGVDPCHLWSATWPGGSRTLRPEDVSHLAPDGDFIRNAIEYGIWSDSATSAQLARTLTERTWSGNPARPHGYVDGRYVWPYTGTTPATRDTTIDWDLATGGSLAYAHLGNIVGGDPQVFEMARAMLFSGMLSRFGTDWGAAGTTSVFGLHPAAQLLANRPPDFALGSQWERVAGLQDSVFESSGGVRFDPEQRLENRYVPNMRGDGTPGGPWDLMSRIDPDHSDGREVRFLVDLPKGMSGRVSLSLTWWGGPAKVELLSQTLFDSRPTLGFVPVVPLPETIDGYKTDTIEQRWWRTTFVLPEDAFYDALPGVAGTNLRLRVRGASGALVAVHRLEATVLLPASTTLDDGTTCEPVTPALGLASACIYHVAVDGSDAGTGSQQSPWRTVARALAQAGPGDVIRLGPGDFAESVHIGHSGEDGAPIVIEGSRGPNGELLSRIIGGVEVDPTSWTEAFELGPDVYRNETLPFGPELLIVDGQSVPRVHPTKVEVELWPLLALPANGTVLTHQDPIVSVPFWDAVYGVFGYQSGSTPVTYLRLADGRDPRESAISISSGSVVSIEDAAYVTLSGLSLEGAEFGVEISGPGAHHVLVEDCHVKHGRRRFEVSDGASHVTLRNNLIEMGTLTIVPGAWFGGNGALHLLRRYAYEYYKYLASPTPTSDDRAIVLEQNVSNILIEGNTITGAIIGIEIAASSNVEIRNNALSNFSSAALGLRPGTLGLQFHDNLVVNANIGVRPQDLGGGAGHLAYIYRNQFRMDDDASDPIGTHVYFHQHYQHPANEVVTDPKVYIYHNSFVGGLKAFSPPVLSDLHDDHWMKEIVIVNNLMSSFRPWVGPHLDIPDFVGAFDYNWVGGDLNSQYSSPYPLWFGLFNVIRDLVYVTPETALDPDAAASLPTGVLESGVDLAHAFTANGRTMPPLPGMIPGYFPGAAPDIGAVQFNR